MAILKFGIVGGGSVFGSTHLRAARFDNLAVPAAGCFSRDEEKNKRLSALTGILTERCYPDYKTMAEREQQRSDKIDFVIIATPNVFHYEMARCFLEAGFHVMLEKPMTFTSGEAAELADLADKKGLLLNMTFTYTGFPIIRQLRGLIRAGGIGKILMVIAEFLQGSVAEEYLATGKLSAWRTKPDMAGISCSEADLGVHTECLLRYVTGLEIESLSACHNNFGYPADLELNSMIMLRYTNGAVGQYVSSKVCLGAYNSLRFRVFGEKGSAAWDLRAPEEACVSKYNQPDQILRSARPYLLDEVKNLPRSGHSLSDGVPGALAQLYSAMINDIVLLQKGEKPLRDYPNARDGVTSMKYIEAAVKSAKNNSAWVKAG